MPPIRVLVVDDSVVVRRIVTEMIDRDPDLEVCGTARDGADALRQVDVAKPDIMTLDVEMPVMDGLETLRNLRNVHPDLPVVMFSTLTTEGSSAALDALALGAKDCVGKPSNVGRTKDVASQFEEELIPKLKALVPAKAPRSRGAAPIGAPLRQRADEAFGDGRVARTVMEHLGVIIHRESDGTYLLMSASSSAESFLHAVETSIKYVT